MKTPMFSSSVTWLHLCFSVHCKSNCSLFSRDLSPEEHHSVMRLWHFLILRMGHFFQYPEIHTQVREQSCMTLWIQSGANDAPCKVHFNLLWGNTWTGMMPDPWVWFSRLLTQAKTYLRQTNLRLSVPWILTLCEITHPFYYIASRKVLDVTQAHLLEIMLHCSITDTRVKILLKMMCKMSRCCYRTVHLIL